MRGNEQGVFIEINGQAQWRSVTLGLRNAAMVEVTEGLNAQDIVIKTTLPSASLRDGRRVKSP